MQDRRKNRSSDPDEAIQNLLHAVATDQEGHGIALVDDRGRLLAGAGSPREMWAAARAAQGKATEEDGPISVHPIASSDGNLVLAALGVLQDAARMKGAAEGVARILSAPLN
jgi:hypothetical protein